MIDGIVIGLIGLFALVGALLMPHALEFKGVLGFMIGAGFLPAVCGATVVILAILLILSERKSRKGATKSAAAPSDAAVQERRSKITNYIIMLLIFGLFIFLMGKVHFTLLTFLYFITFYIFAYRNQLPKMKSILKVFILSIGATFFLAYLLPTFLQIPLP